MYVNVSVVVVVKEVLKWTMFHVTLEYTFTKLLEVSLERASTSELESSKCKCCSNQDIKQYEKVEVPFEVSVIECCELNGKCICFIFTTDTESNATLYNKSAVEEVTLCIILIILLCFYD